MLGFLASVEYVIVFYRHSSKLLSRDSKWPRLLKGRLLSTSQLMQMAQFSSKVSCRAFVLALETCECFRVVVKSTPHLNNRVPTRPHSSYHHI